MEYNIYYLDITYTMPGHGTNPPEVVERPNVARIVESRVKKEDLETRQRWWGDKYKNGRFTTVKVGSRMDTLLSKGIIDAREV